MNERFQTFATKVKRQLLKLGTVVRDKDRDYLEFLFERFCREGRIKENRPLVVTLPFILNKTAEFLSIPIDELRFLLKSRCSPRIPTSLMTFSQLQDASQSQYRNRLIRMIGRKSAPQFKLTTESGAPLTPGKQANVKQKLHNLDYSFSPLGTILSSNHAPRKRALNKRGELFERDIRHHDIAVWRKKTPQKEMSGSVNASPDRLRYKLSFPDTPRSRKIRGALFFSPKKEETSIKEFQFTVTRESLQSRLHARRPTSQKQVMGGYTASEVLRAVGYIIYEELSRSYHWAHRQGWLFGGAQQQDNLDPTTAGSNYDTLFKVEAPIAELLFEKKYDSVMIQGTVEFKPDNPAPFRITYRIDCGNGKPVEVVIDPLSHRIPTIAEFELAKSLYASGELTQEEPLSSPRP